MIALCDCNSFYASCHALFDPTLWDKPIIVLSNNRGVIVSLNKKAKEIGLKRGLNEYELKGFLRKNRVAVMESNYELYNDISGRVMTTLAGFVEKIQIESIDEAFLCLDGFDRSGLNDYGLHIADTVKKNIGVPVSLGIAETKTLAKLANRFAKKYPRFKNSFAIDTEEKRIECLRRTDIGDVWGIGSELRDKLNAAKIFTALDFTTKITQSKARKFHNVELERTWCELQGIRCYGIETTPPDKKSLITSRIFPHPVKDKESLRQALATYAAICASDLRGQRSYAVSIGIFLETTAYHKNRPPYRLRTHIRLPFPANTTLTIVKYALQALDGLYINGLEYKKTGIDIPEITRTIQTDLYHPIDKEMKNARLNPVEDFYAHGFDRKYCALAVMGYGHRHRIDPEHISPLLCPTTQFNHILRINCNDK